MTCAGIKHHFPKHKEHAMKHVLSTALLLALSAPMAQAGSLTLFATGEDLATEGFSAPELTKDGWALEFSRVVATLADVSAWVTEPPFMGDGPEITGTELVIGGPFALDLADADEDDRVKVATVDAEPGFYNALSWALIPATEGEFAGFSLVLEGTATREGKEVAFTLSTRDSVAYTCGEYVGDARKGFVTADAGGDLEITLHLDHVFGRADKKANDPMNLEALGFDDFSEGGMQEFSLDGLHLGHVGEGHCHAQAL